MGLFAANDYLALQERGVRGRGLTTFTSQEFVLVHALASCCHGALLVVHHRCMSRRGNRLRHTMHYLFR